MDIQYTIDLMEAKTVLINQIGLKIKELLVQHGSVIKLFLPHTTKLLFH